MSAINLKPVWNATLDVYKEVAKICDRHGLRYYLTDGSAIGAVRHGGFVPWDDDFDMSMPREDYEAFLEYANDELPQNLKVVTWKNTPEFGYLFGKVQEVRRERIECVEQACGYMLAGGIYVDIIPIDGYPESRVEQFVVKWYSEILRQIWRFKWRRYEDQSHRGRIAWYMGALLSAFMPWIRKPEQVMRTCESFLLKHPFAASKFTGRASLYLTMLNRKPLPISVWGEASRYSFGGENVPLPHDVDSYLRFYYGDYMKLPPEEQRHPLHEYNTRCAWWLGPTH